MIVFGLILIKAFLIKGDSANVTPIFQAAFDGQVHSKYIISGRYIGTINYLSRELPARGKILVTKDKNDKDDPSKWQCMSIDKINIYKKLSRDDLRKNIYEVLTEAVNYNRSTPYIWRAGSRTKEFIMKYCRFQSESFGNCKLLTSSDEVKKLLKSK